MEGRAPRPSLWSRTSRRSIVLRRGKPCRHGKSDALLAAGIENQLFQQPAGEAEDWSYPPPPPISTIEAECLSTTDGYGSQFRPASRLPPARGREPPPPLVPRPAVRRPHGRPGVGLPRPRNRPGGPRSFLVHPRSS